MKNFTEITNSLIYKANKIVGKEHIFVTIKLNNECKNKFQSFSITGSIYEAKKPKEDKYYISGGCIHEDILKHFPQFKQFIDLHLADVCGYPMFALENGFYHLKNGFTTTLVDDINFKKQFCDCYRIDEKHFEILKASKNAIDFAYNLIELGICNVWEQQAVKAISDLEQLTNKKFIIENV